MVYLTRKEHFNAAHKLYNPKWSKAENEKVFGLCANENWHGHNYDLFVTIKGIPNENTGFVYDAKKLGELINAMKTIEGENSDLFYNMSRMFARYCGRREAVL